MSFSLKTEVFKSLLIYITILLLSSCNSREYKQNKDVRKPLEMKKDLVQNETPSINAEQKIKTEIQQEQKSEKEIEKTKEVIKKKEIRKPTPFQTGSTPSGGSAKCFGGKIRFYDKDTNTVKRFYTSIPNTRNIKNEEFCKISFKVIADPNGNVISVRVTSSGTTTKNQELINQVRELVKSELKYNKVDPETPVFSDNITVVIQPN